MQKAKSRLKAIQKSAPRATRPAPVQRKRAPKGSKSAVKSRHWHHLPTLLISLPFYAGAYYLVTKVSPQSIRHFLIPNTFLPLQFILMIANFFGFSYLLLSTRRGLAASLIISSTLFFKLQGIVNYYQPALIVAGVIIVIETVLILLKKDWFNLV